MPLAPSRAVTSAEPDPTTAITVACQPGAAARDIASASGVRVSDPVVASISTSAPRAHQNVCAFPWQQMIIDLTGEVVPCCFWSGYGNGGKPLGNTNIHSIDEIWNGPGYQDLRRRIVEDQSKEFPCHDCLVAEWHGQHPPFTWPSAFVADQGFCHHGPILRSFFDRAMALEDDWSLMEDGQPLGPADAPLDDIRMLGAGRFFVGDAEEGIANRCAILQIVGGRGPADLGRAKPAEGGERRLGTVGPGVADACHEGG